MPDRENQDLFFLENKDSVIWIYRNFDSCCGDQIVLNYFGKWLFEKCIRCETTEDVFEELECECNQYLVDCDADDFEWWLDYFNTAEPLAVGMTDETLKKLREALL